MDWGTSATGDAMKGLLAAISLLAMSTAAAFADQITLGRGDGDGVRLWSSYSNFMYAMQFILTDTANNEYDLMMSMTACFAADGDRAEVVEAYVDGSVYDAYLVSVTSGEQAGCHGVVERSDTRQLAP